MNLLQFRVRDPKATLALVGLVATCALAVLSAGLKYELVWDQLTSERARDEALTATERERAPLAAIPLAAEVFDYYAAFLRPGDRVYFHVLPSGFSEFADLRTLVAAAGRFWLLPAIEVAEVDDATVVVSWERDPAELKVRFVEQHRAGLQLFFVSRIAR